MFGKILAALLLTGILLAGEGSCQCFNSTDCMGSEVNASGCEVNVSDIKECCVRTNDGLSFDNGTSCTNCIVHGFQQAVYKVSEDARLDTEFRRSVKGTSQFGDALILNGVIRAAAYGTANNTDFQRLEPVRVLGDVTEIRVFTANDEITLEYNDSILLTYTPSAAGLIPGVEGAGEYVRDTAIVRIIDNDILEINFEESDYSIIEGISVLSTNLTLTFRTNQNPFSVELSPVIIDAAQNLSLDSFISFDNIEPTFRATGDDFTNKSLVITIPANLQRYTIKQFFNVTDDNIDEDEQSFAIVAKIGPDVPENISCFQIGVGGTECNGRLGAIQIRITDNDPMVIGFAERTQTVSESIVPPGEDIATVLIPLATLRTAEREHPMNFRLQVSSSSAIVEPIGAVVNILYDAVFGRRENNPNDPIEELFILEALEDTIPSLIAFIRNDLRPEDEECLTIRILPVDVPGRRELFTCNEDDSGEDKYFCQHTICIKDDDDPFVVAFVETTYTVDESVGAVNVCVNLIEPMIDILDERVNVFVIDNSSSVYIPPGASLATPDEPNFLSMYPIADGTDFAQQTPAVNVIDDTFITELMRLMCYNQLIYDDTCVELDEYAGLTLGVIDNNNVLTTVQTEVEPTYDQASILIVDNDMATVGLDETFYSTPEDGGAVEVCVVVYTPDIDCPICFPFNVLLSTRDFSAGSPMDYGAAVKTIVQFNECERRSCISIPIVDDEVPENTEYFNLTLERNGLHERIKLDPTDGVVQITDNDMAVVGLEETFHRVSEGVGFVEVCAIVYRPNGNLECPIEFAFDVDFSTSDGSAVFTMDYGSVDTTLQFDACEMRSCVNVSITNDDTLENTESFFVNLERNGLDNRITLDPTRGEIEILDDDDMAVVGLEETFYRTAEGEGAVEVCAIVYMPDDTVPCPIAFEFTVYLSNANFTAVTPMDYGELLDAPLVFPPCERRSCVDIPIVDDNVVENSELFNVTLERNGLDGRITLDPVDGMVEITDNDDAVIGLERTMYTVEEDVVVVEVCTIVYRPTGSCPIAFDFTVQFFTTDISANAGSDYVDSDTLHMFAACEDERCVNVGIINDDMTEDTEVLSISLGIPSDIRITVNPPEGKIYILDNDMRNDTILVNDTVTGDPLMTVPVFDAPDIMNLCYEVHGEADRFFNLISDNCVAVNAHYARAGTNNPNIRLNVIDSVGVRAVSSDESCVNIQVDLEGCSATVDDVSVNMPYRANSISVRRYNNRVRIAVPNCRDTDLVMWVFCTSGSTEDPFTWVYYNFDFLRFVVMRGINLDESSHGLIGQFWNVPVDVQEHTDLFNGENRDDDFTVTVRYPGSDDRRFVALRSSVTWEFEKKPCLYVGNSQAGPLGEVVDPNDSVIEGTYKDYIVESIFSPIFKFAHIDDENCMTK